MIAQLFPILCGLASISFLACARRVGQAWFWLAGFVLVWLLGLPWLGAPVLLLNDPQEVAIVVSVFAFTILHHHSWRRLALVMAGIMAACWQLALVGLGIPLPWSLVLILAVSALGFAATLRRREFVSDELLDEAFTIVLILALLVAVVPAVLQGWQAASSLQALDGSGSDDSLSPVTLLIAGLAMLLGVARKSLGSLLPWSKKQSNNDF